MRAVNCHKNQRGMALLITVATLSLLIALTVEFHRGAWQDLLTADSKKEYARLRGIALSGIGIAEPLLELDGSLGTVDSLVEPWATLEKGVLDELFPEDNFELEIIDLSGRFQINSLVVEKEGQEGQQENPAARQLLISLLLSGDFAVEDEGQAREIVDSLVDWLDADDQESEYGAEDSYYQSLEIPYSCRNGPMGYSEELLLVKGITPELFHGDDKTLALKDFINPYGDQSQINLNTAPMPLLAALEPGLSQEMVERLDAFRRQEENFELLASPDWYRQVDGWPGDITLPAELLSTSSSYFQIIARVGRDDNLGLTLDAFVQRLKGGRISLLERRLN